MRGTITVAGRLATLLPASLVANTAQITTTTPDLYPGNNRASVGIAVDGAPQVITINPDDTGITHTFGSLCGSVYFTSAVQLPASVTMTYTERIRHNLRVL